MQELLTLEDVAQVLKCNSQTVRKLVKSGKLKGQLIAGRYIIKREDLEAFIEGKTND
jgi:excisionase family DNA binding protein